MSARLARPEIAALSPYRAARQQDGTLRLNANEVPSSPATATLNRYPLLRQQALESRLADLYGIPADALLATRGSSEAIDLLVRTFCRAYRDRILVMPPTFAMYAVYAGMQGAAVDEVPLAADDDFAVDGAAVLEACGDDTKLVFVCSPNNPTGGLVPRDTILELADERRDRSLVVVDEAYVEFSGVRSLVAEAAGRDNLVVLRTLSKAWGLAGARCGAIAAGPDVVALLRRMLPPYAFSTPAADAIHTALAPRAVDAAARQVTEIIAERERLRGALAALPCVSRVWPSDANFLLVRFDDLAAVEARLADAGILVRVYAGSATLANCARITIARRDDNDRLLDALASLAGVHA